MILCIGPSHDLGWIASQLGKLRSLVLWAHSESEAVERCREAGYAAILMVIVGSLERESNGLFAWLGTSARENIRGEFVGFFATAADETVVKGSDLFGRTYPRQEIPGLIRSRIGALTA